MNSSTYRRPGAFSPRPSTPADPSQRRPVSTDPSESDSSSSSQVTTLSIDKRPSNSQQSQYPSPRPSGYPRSNSNSSTTSVNNFSRPTIPHANSDLPSRKSSPLIGPDLQRHKRQHSQGFFEPSLPTATLADHAAMAKLTASQIAAQAAMQHQSSTQHARKRSQTVPSPQSPPEPATGRRKPPPIQTVRDPSRMPSGLGTPTQQYYNGLVGGNTAAATTAANAAFPRTPQLSPGLTTFQAPTEKEHKLKTERSKMKLFSKPKQLAISSNKEVDHKDRPLPSPNKMGPSGSSGLSKIINPSMASLADSMTTGGAPSIYSTNNASTSTLVPANHEKEKEKAHKHHFLSRQKNKLRERMDDHALPLSSASSNSKPLDPSAPQSLYSFAPASPGPTAASFAKSVSGLDLRHGGRALREKKKEEKAAAIPPFEIRRPEADPSTNLSTSAPGNASLAGVHSVDVPGQSILQGFGLNNMSPEDAWDFLKAKILIIFEGEELRMPVEDLNRLVSVHIQRCISKRLPTIIIDDLRDMLQTGFLSLDQTLRGVPDQGLVTQLVNIWLHVFGTVLPYMQAVFLPLDLEFKGHGTILSPQEAAEFWGANPDSTENAFGNEFDVRRVVLISYRDNVILPRHDSLKATFSRLSLKSINAGVNVSNESPNPSGRPGTAASLDPAFASFNSQGSTLLGDTAGARSRATSNLSAPELPPFASPSARRHAPLDSSQVTETVGRMLQCVTVLASVQSGDDAQLKMEDLAKALKLNWLGRGRTGRNRRGFVGARIRPPIVHGNSGVQTEHVDESRRASML